MRKLLPLAALFAAFTLAAPAMADGVAGATTTGASTTSASTTTAATKPATPDPDEMVCKHSEIVGSRIPGPRECHTRREWAQMSNDGRDTVSGMQNRGQTMTPLNGN